MFKYFKWGGFWVFVNVYWQFKIWKYSFFYLSSTGTLKFAHIGATGGGKETRGWVCAHGGEGLLEASSFMS